MKRKLLSAIYLAAFFLLSALLLTPALAETESGRHTRLIPLAPRPDTVAAPGYGAVRLIDTTGNRRTFNLTRSLAISARGDSLTVESELGKELLSLSALEGMDFMQHADSTLMPPPVSPTADFLAGIGGSQDVAPGSSADKNVKEDSGLVLKIDADKEWLHFHSGPRLLPPVRIREIEKMTFVGAEKQASAGIIPVGDPYLFLAGSDTLSILAAGVDRRYPLASVDSVRRGTNVPAIRLDIEGGKEVTEKGNYLSAVISLEGFGEYEDFAPMDVSIKGRGNSTWQLPKKPYRLKFAKKQSLAGLKKAKSYVLLANFLDPSMMKNALAFRLAELLGMEYPIHNIPVDLYVNGRYRGAYTLNEKPGINSGSVDIDEAKGIMWELDTNFDEEFQYHTPIYQLPAMVKDPDLNEVWEENGSCPSAEEYFSLWQEDLNVMEEVVAMCDSTLADYIDLPSAARFALVNNFCANIDINNPKSINLYKTELGEPYRFGPVWDFDWGFTFRGYSIPENLGRAELPMIRSDLSGVNVGFWIDLFRNPLFMEEYRAVWEDFRDCLYPLLMEYFDEYADLIRASAAADAEIWNASTAPAYSLIYEEGDHHDRVELLREFIRIRMEYMDKSPTLGLY